MYADTVTRIKRQPAKQAALAIHALTWLAYANAPLSIEDLRQAIAATPPTFTAKDTHTPLEEDLVAACCGLISVDKESRQVRLIRTFKPYPHARL